MKSNQSDAVVLVATKQSKAHESDLVPIVVETSNDHYVVVGKKEIPKDMLQKLPVYVLFETGVARIYEFKPFQIFQSIR